MSLVVDDDLRFLFRFVTGDEFPDADEDVLRALAEAWERVGWWLRDGLGPQLRGALGLTESLYAKENAAPNARYKRKRKKNPRDQWKDLKTEEARADLIVNEEERAEKVRKLREEITALENSEKYKKHEARRQRKAAYDAERWARNRGKRRTGEAEADRVVRPDDSGLTYSGGFGTGQGGSGYGGGESSTSGYYNLNVAGPSSANASGYGFDTSEFDYPMADVWDSGGRQTGDTTYGPPVVDYSGPFAGRSTYPESGAEPAPATGNTPAPDWLGYQGSQDDVMDTFFQSEW